VRRYTGIIHVWQILIVVAVDEAVYLKVAVGLVNRNGLASVNPSRERPEAMKRGSDSGE
jgi:hypothetical protein